MAFRLKRDTDSAWVESDFGSGIEKYKIAYYSMEHQVELLKKHGYRKKGKKYAKDEYDITDEKALKLRQESFNNILLDWDDSIQDENGKPVKCGEKEKNQFVIDSFARVFWIILKARNIMTFLPDMEHAAKNSNRPSNTKKNTEEARNNLPLAEPVSQ